MKEYDLRISIMKRTDITPSDKLVLLGVLLCVDWNSMSGRVSVGDVSALTGITTRQVKRSFKRMTLAGFISRESKYIVSEKRHTTARIQINTPLPSDQMSPPPSDQMSPPPSDQMSPPPSDQMSPSSITNNNNNNKSNKEGDLKIDWDQFKHLSKSEFDNLPPEGQLAYQTKAITCSAWGAWQYNEFLEEFNSTMETRQ